MSVRCSSCPTLAECVVYITTPWRVLVKKCIGNEVIVPGTILAAAFEMFFLILTLALAFTITYEFAFFRNGISFGPFNVASEVLFLFEILIKFQTALVKENGEIVADIRLISENYIWKGSFLRDIVTAVQ